MDFCGKSSGFADCGSAVIFDTDSGLCPSYVRTLGPKRNLDRRSFFSLDRFVSESKLFLFSKEVDSKLGVRLLLVLYCVVVIKHVAFFFTIWAKLTVACKL